MTWDERDANIIELTTTNMTLRAALDEQADDLEDAYEEIEQLETDIQLLQQLPTHQRTSNILYLMLALINLATLILVALK